jgi:tripartite-type tricarboxylate transporter receptor subunit TctC
VQAAVNSQPDGYTLVSVTSTNSSNATLFESLPFNLLRDIAPVGFLSKVPLVLGVNRSVPAKSVAEFIAYAKTNPGKVSVASFGVGSISHLAQELFKAMTDINVVHVPYRGDAPALTDTISGQVQATFSTVTASAEYVRAGKLRALGVTSAMRWETLPEVPPVSEFVPGYEVTTWAGLGAPKNTPTEIINKLNKEINAAFADAKMKARFANVGSVPIAMTPTEFGKLIAGDTEKWAKVIRAANIKAE